MFHKVKAVNALPDYRLSVQFAEGVTKIYDVKPLFSKWAPFKTLEHDPALFSNVEVDVAATGSSGTMISICPATSSLKTV